MRRAIMAALFSIASTAACAQAAKIVQTAAGPTLQTQDGRSLFVYDGDEVNKTGAGKSSCNRQCALEWPPFRVGRAAKAHGSWSIIHRGDGSLQWAYKERPLYTFAKASTPEPTAGNGANGNKWHLAKP